MPEMFTEHGTDTLLRKVIDDTMRNLGSEYNLVPDTRERVFHAMRDTAHAPHTFEAFHERLTEEFRKCIAQER